MLLEKRPAYQFDLSLLRLAFYFPDMKHEVDELYFFIYIYQQNIDLYTCNYKFYDIKDNQVINCKIFSPYTQFKSKGFEFEDTKKERNIMLSQTIKITILFVI